MNVTADVRVRPHLPATITPDVMRQGVHGSEAARLPIASTTSSIIRACSELVIGLARHADAATSNPSTSLELFRHNAKAWAQQGISIAVVHRAIKQAIDEAIDSAAAEAPSANPRALIASTQRLLRVHAAITTAVSEIFVAETHADAGRPPRPLSAVAVSLTPGHRSAPPAGLELADTYAVLAVAITHATDDTDLPDPASAKTEHLQRLRAALSEQTGHRAFEILGAHGGTILIPATPRTDAELDNFVAELSVAAQTPILAIVLYSDRDRVRDTADRAHELLDVAQRLRYPSRLYRFSDLALEFQLTRPGHANDGLASLIEPLEAHQDLLHTLQLFIDTNLNRQQTAQLLDLHRNTIDYRLRRIEELTGHNPAQQGGIWHLRSALIVRAYRRITD
ncbi:PucR family transcriptional regulator [Nocardia sp. NPDC127579]|uniref:PucR family transcriptional regulator n=1 Tax=Nocardia sp. NPDC127579 TaxID=3345402 RepID=UPI003637A627